MHRVNFGCSHLPRCIRLGLQTAALAQYWNHFRNYFNRPLRQKKLGKSPGLKENISLKIFKHFSKEAVNHRTKHSRKKNNIDSISALHLNSIPLVFLNRTPFHFSGQPTKDNVVTLSSNTEVCYVLCIFLRYFCAHLSC